MASVKSLKSIFRTEDIIRKPTMIRAGAVAKEGMARKIGDRNRDSPKKIAATTDVRPVLPPSATPDALSTNVVVVDVPNTAPRPSNSRIICPVYLKVYISV